MRIAVQSWVLMLVLVGCPEPDEPPERPEDPAAESPPAPSPEELEQARLEAERRAEAEEAERLLQAEQEAARLEAEAVAAAEAAELARIEAEREAFERTYPLHGVCYHFLAQVFESARRGRVVGYMRRGATFRAKPGVRGRDCQGFWHEIPGAGFVCGGAGYRLGDEPQVFEDSPVQPDLAQPMPYRYAFLAGDNVPQFWRVPSATDATEAAAAIAELVAAEEAPPEGTGSDEMSASDAGAGVVEAVPPALPAESEVMEPDVAPPLDDVETVEDGEAEIDPTLIEAAPPPGQEGEEIDDASENAEGEEVEQERVLPSFVRQRMRRGFYVSLDADERSASEAYTRTVRGGYIRRAALTNNEAPSGRGVVLGEGWQLPIGFVYRRGTRSLRREREDGPLNLAGSLSPHTAFVVHERFERRGRSYRVDPDGLIVRRRSLRIAQRIERPSDVGESDQWIHVDLSEQTLVAYEGDQPVFATIVASGKEGFETPTGLFRIESKHITTTMDDLESADAPYSIEDVPWTMYFSGNFALHAAFWHERFGRPRSHGCVNLTPTDARWLFQWSTPLLPQGWHGMFVQRRAARAWVNITE